MDHLPVFKDPTKPYPQVPYLGADNLPSDAFNEVPRQQGWDAETLWNGNISECQDERAKASFMQAWLYFGLLSELSASSHKSAPKLQDFAKDEGPRKVVTGKHLDKFIQMRVLNISKMSGKKKSDAMQRLEAALDTTSKVVGHQWSSLSDTAPSADLVAVIQSIMVLGSTIDLALEKLKLATRKRQWRLVEVAKLSMAREGWCRRDMSMAESGLSDLSMYCASHLRRHSEHSGSFYVAPERHDKCTTNACEESQVDEATYQTVHATDTCQCEFWRVNQRELEHIIEQDRIPYIQLKLESGDSSEKNGGRRKLVPSLGSLSNSTAQGPHNRFVIFSHVWSDGLGNPHENALPMCQLQRFYDILEDSPWEDVLGRQMLDSHDQSGRYKNKRMRESALSFPPRSWRRWNRRTFNKSMRIWIDTLCVPLAPAARKTAIGMLKRYYSYATMTVVLDKSLYNLHMKAYSDSELLLRIGLSAWMSRCWTMQEAVIAGGALSVRFADGWYPLMDIVAFIRGKNSTISTNVMNDQQRNKIKNWRTGLMVFCIPFTIFTYLLQPGKAFRGLVKKAVCGMCGSVCGRRKGEADGLGKNGLAASERLFNDSKEFFTPIATLCKRIERRSILSDNAEVINDTIRRTVSSWHGLRYRNTSHQSDRFLNFAFGCAKNDKDFDNMRRILKLPANDRLRAWYLEQVALPSGLLFIEGPRMSTPGFHWAPLDIHPSFIEDESPASCLTKTKFRESGAEGSLRLDKPSLMLEKPGQIGTSVWQAYDRSSGLLHLVNLDWQSSKDPGIRPTAFQGSLAVILSRLPPLGHTTSAAVVEKVARLSKQNSGNFVCRAVVMTQAADSVHGEPDVVPVYLAKMQRWIVS